MISGWYPTWFSKVLALLGSWKSLISITIKRWHACGNKSTSRNKATRASVALTVNVPPQSALPTASTYRNKGHEKEMESLFKALGQGKGKDNRNYF